MSLFQNSVSFGKGFGKTVQKAGFSVKSKVDFPKTEVLENPNLTDIVFIDIIQIIDKLRLKHGKKIFPGCSSSFFIRQK